jgi:transposase
MRATSVLRTILGFQHTFVTGVHFEDDAFVVDVAPSYKVPRCSGCKRKVKAGYDQRPRSWRHLDLGGMLTEIRYTIRRVDCPKCGIRVEKVPWAETGSRFTLPFENQVAYLAQRCDKTAVTKLMRIAWVSVGEIAARVVKRGGLTGPARLDGMTVIGIDELNYRKHHKYVTIVTDHLRGCAVWAAEGKGAETAAKFFAELGPERCAKLEVVTLDLSAAFISAVKASAPNAKQIYDRFHVQRLAHDALDEVRRVLVHEADDEAERKALKGTRWALQKNPWNLDADETKTLQEIRTRNEPLYRAYELKESLAGILDRRQVNVARVKLREWTDWASRSQLAPFVRIAKTIRKYMDGILEYIRTGFNNGRAEGINNKVRSVIKRAFGFHDATSLIGMLLLCCGGLHLNPSHVCPYSTH